MVPLNTLKLLKMAGRGVVRGSVRSKSDGANVIMTALAFWSDMLSTKPSISPRTVPGWAPGVMPPLKKLKSKVSAWHGADNSANTDANANAPKVILFMIRSLLVTLRKKVTDLDCLLGAYLGLHF